jgi:hypothetical protein
VVAAVREVAPVPTVNGGGTGSVHLTRREPVITEITAGSGFFASTLFDRYADFELTPAAMFAMPVVRRPGPFSALETSADGQRLCRASMKTVFRSPGLRATYAEPPVAVAKSRRARSSSFSSPTVLGSPIATV